MITSPLKWPGAKSFLLPQLRALYTPHRHRRVVEPFVGSMAVSLGLQPSRALLSDANPHLINFYARLKHDRPFEIEMQNSESLYYAYRECFNDLIATSARHTRTAGELFYYLNRTGFNGLCRFNRMGKYNVPFGKYDTITYRRNFTEYTALLSRWEIAHKSFEDVRIAPDDFVYLDPPYDGTFVDYSAGGFSWQQQIALAFMFAQHPGPVVASNMATDRIVRLYTNLGFTVEKILAPRRISSNGNREPALEVLARKNC